MALGAYQAAVTRARLTGQPVPIGNQGLVVYPAGNIGTPGGGGFGRPTLPVPPIPPATQPLATQPVAPSSPYSAAGVQGLPGSPSGPAVAPPQHPSWWRQMLAPNSGVDQGLNYGTPVASIPTINVHAPPVLNQANPNTTYVSPNTPQPPGAVPVPGQTDTQSGPPVHATYNMPPAPDVATQARRYRAQHGLSTSDDADALNAESLAAAQAGRTYFDPKLAAQYAQPLAAGVYGPRTDVVNALSLPPDGNLAGRAILTPNGVVAGRFGDPSTTLQ